MLAFRSRVLLGDRGGQCRLQLGAGGRSAFGGERYSQGTIFFRVGSTVTRWISGALIMGEDGAGTMRDRDLLRHLPYFPAPID